MVFVPGSGLIGNLLVVMCMLVLLVLMGRNLWRTARRPDPGRPDPGGQDPGRHERNDREDGDEPR